MTPKDSSERHPSRRFSESRQADRAARETEERYQALFSSLDCVYLHDFEGRFLDANPAALKLLGYEREEILSLSFPSLLDVDLAGALGVLAQLLETGTQKTPTEFRLRCKTGEYVYVETKSSVIFRDGQPYAVLGVARDITERKRAEAELRASEDRYKTLVNLSPEAIIVGVGGKCAFANPAAVKLFGAASPLELVGTDMFDHIDPRDRELMAHRIAQSLAGVETKPVAARALRLDGRPVEVEVNSTGIEYDRAPATLLLVRDITEHREAEEELRASQQMVEGIINAIPVRVFWKDRNLVYLGCNAIFARDAGFADPKDIVGKDDHQMGWREQADSYRSDDLKVMESGHPRLLIEEPQTTPEGKSITLLTSKVPLRNAQGEISGLLGTYLDITGRKQAEEDLRVSEEQLRQSQKMEAVGQLAGGIAHDFNNLLAAILGYSDLILTSGVSSLDEARPDIEEIKRAAERASALTKQILAFSRRQTLRPAVVSLNEILMGMEALLRRTLGEDIDLVALKAPDLGSVEADVHQFEQVIMNLAVNARDAMVSGGRLTLETGNVELDKEYCRTHPEATPGSYVMLAVSDTGVGMEEATLEHIFEPFFTTKASGLGTGLGLATVYGIVRQSNGSIAVFTELGKGTSFKIYLPRVIEPVRDEVPTTARVAAARGNETILLVEDAVSLRNLVTRVLGSLGYRVLSAGTATEALQVLAKADCRLDLLLTDVVLPGGVHGNELARELLVSMPELPVLYVSGYPRNAIVHGGRLDEGVNFLEKPFTPDALARMVREVLDRSIS